MSIITRKGCDTTSDCFGGLTAAATRRGRRAVFFAVAVATCAAAVVGYPAQAAAQQATSEDEGVSVKGKGITGGVLLGAELVMAVEAAFGVRSTWAYIGGGAAGAIGGGIGGYFVEKTSSPKPANYLLVGGMALLIPTTVLILHTTAYRAPDHFVADEPGEGVQPVDSVPGAQEPGTTVKVTGPQAKNGSKSKNETARKAPTSKQWVAHRAAPSRAPHVPMSLVDVHDGALSLSIPAVQLHPVYSDEQLWKFRVSQKTELRVPVFQASF